VSAPRSLVLAGLLLLAALAGCGDLPRPFEGNPGRLGARLVQPPPARLAVSSPAGAMLPDEATHAYASDVVEALLRREVPAVDDPPRQGDWRLQLGATLRDGKVVPSFVVQDPAGKPLGTTEGTPIAAAAWAQASPTTLKQVADSAGPQVAQLLTRIDAARRLSDPNSLHNRQARVMVAAVTGAPGDGNTQLARHMRDALPQLGVIVQDTETGADFTVTGTVTTSPGSDGQTKVEVQWLVSDVYRRDIGHVVQLNEVPAGSLDGYWGDVAMVVAQQAAGGVHDVILKQNEAIEDAAAQGKADAAKQGAANPPDQPAAPSGPPAKPAPASPVAAQPLTAPPAAGPVSAAPTSAQPTISAP
jgi:hypothetical protein